MSGCQADLQQFKPYNLVSKKGRTYYSNKNRK